MNPNDTEDCVVSAVNGVAGKIRIDEDAGSLEGVIGLLHAIADEGFDLFGFVHAATPSLRMVATSGLTD